MTEPTDAEIDALWRELFQQHQHSRGSFARAVLAKWSTPPAVAPWRSAVLDLIDDCPGLTLEQDRWLSRRVKELDFASTPQPTQAQAGVPPPVATGEPYAYAVYFPDQPCEELVHDLDDLCEDLTNRGHAITKLYAAQQPVTLNAIDLMRVVMDADNETRSFAIRGTTNWAAHIGRAVQDAIVTATNKEKANAPSDHQ